MPTATNSNEEVGRIETNYMESFFFLESRKRRQVSQLVLLNNLQRGEQNIASTLLITLFNRVLSSLYDDKLQVKFLPSQGIKQEQLNSYNTLAQSDYLEMKKAEIDYEWVWDALFFGRGYCETYQFDKKRKIMKPHIINPLVFGYDPYFTDPQDWRYYWKWITKSKYQLDRLIKAGKITGIKNTSEIPSGVDPFLYEYKSKRDAAQKGNEPPIESAISDVFQILEYYGYNSAGKKCVYWVDKNFSKILFEEELEFDDSVGEDDEVDSRWPIVAKESFRIPHSSISFSIADILEDKHRAESVLLNLMYISAKDAANPLYWYDPDKVKDVAQFFSRQINQHIPVEGDGAMAIGPINKAGVMPPELVNFMTAMRQQANDPVGTGVSLEPATGGQETATEVAIDQQLNDMAQSLQSKVLQFGEAEFWSMWFHRYQKHADELKWKLANIVGVKGISTTEIDLQDFVTDYPPGVFVYSAKEAEYKELVLRRDLMTLYPQLAQTMDPDGLRNFNKHVFMPKFLNDPSLIDVMFPKTLDEIKAEQENEMLKVEQMPEVKATDNHITHIYTHMQVQPKTWATWLHMQWHEEEYAKQQAQAQQQAQMEAQAGAGTPKVGADKKSPLSAASPLKQETANNNAPKKSVTIK